jgi:hypothetical protein
MTPTEGETWWLQQATLWMEMLIYHKVIFEMDCKMVVDDVHNKKYNNSEYGSLFDDCRIILSNHSDFIVAFTRRQTNGNAHTLARAALSPCFSRYFLCYSKLYYYYYYEWNTFSLLASKKVEWHGWKHSCNWLTYNVCAYIYIYILKP